MHTQRVHRDKQCAPQQKPAQLNKTLKTQTYKQQHTQNKNTHMVNTHTNSNI